MGGVTGVPDFSGRTSQFTWNGFNVIEQPKGWDVKYRGNAASHHFLQGETLSMACYSRFHDRQLVTCLTPKPTANRKALELMLQNFDLRLPIPRKRSNPTAASQQTAVNL
jgi:hypothetical protein